jgi:glycoside/pentoside/hexuronide:cation symporter, GPH family
MQTTMGRAGYGVGAIGTGVFTTLPGLLLLFYLTDVLGVSAALAAVLLVVPKAWDVFLAPMVGAWSDRSAARTGSRSPWLLAGALALPPSFALIFLSPFDGTAGGLWVGAWFLVAASAFALFQVPWNALPAEMTEDSAERTRLMTFRIAFLAAGILVAGGLGPLIAEGEDGSRGGYATMGLVLAVVMLAALLSCVRATRSIASSPSSEHLGVAAALRRTSGSRSFRLLAGAYLLQALAVAVLLAGAPYIATYRLDDSGLTAAMFVALVAPSLLVMAPWRRAADRFGKAPALLVATGGFAIGVVALGVSAASGAAGPTLALCALLGAGFAGLQLLPFSLLPDVIAEDEARTGDRPAGAFTGLWSAGETAGAALGPAVYALALALGGFASSDPDERVAQPEGALDVMLWAWAALPVALLVLSLPLLRRLALSPTRKEHA